MTKKKEIGVLANVKRSSR